ncbi:MAG: hypothetical protein ACOYYS_19260 [Chloroflexota bacterium]
MTAIPTNNAPFVWKIKDLPGNPTETPEVTAAKARDLGFSSLLVKVANGTGSYNWRKHPDGTYTDDLIQPFADACEAEGIDLWAWAYYYGSNPAAEAKMAAKRMKDYPCLKGLIIDAEGECKAPGKTAANTYMRTLRAGYTGPLGLTSFRWPSLHPDFPWASFIGKIDFLVPQVYWVKAANPAQQLDRCVLEHYDLHKQLGKTMVPIIPAGAAYHDNENHWQPTVAQMQEFSARAQKLDLPGVSWWEWANAERYHLTAGMSWVPTTPPPPAIPDLPTRVARLEAWAMTQGYPGP